MSLINLRHLPKHSFISLIIPHIQTYHNEFGVLAENNITLKNNKFNSIQPDGSSNIRYFIKKLNNNPILIKEVDKCVDKSGNVLDPETCKKYINTNTDDLNKSFAEYSLRQYAQEEALNEKLNSNKSEVEKYGKLIKFQPSQVTLQVDRARAKDVAQGILSSDLAVDDILIDEVDISDVVRKIFSNGK